MKLNHHYAPEWMLGKMLKSENTLLGVGEHFLQNNSISNFIVLVLKENQHKYLHEMDLGIKVLIIIIKEITKWTLYLRWFHKLYKTLNKQTLYAETQTQPLLQILYRCVMNTMKRHEFSSFFY